MMPWSGMQGQPPQAVGSATGELGFTSSRRWGVLTCQAPSAERLDSAWGTFDYHRRCTLHAARSTQHAPTQHAPTHPRGAESDGLVDLQIKPRQTQIMFVYRLVAKPVSKPARDGPRRWPAYPKPSGSALEKLRAGTRRGNWCLL
ncbi:hypothetical protein DHEL01_v208770 [Diaporthe helianthi]|uniref:Uncharacterized protein n=1 Tax=Diaporthe helianthi TaxID=158607 RepID=A0A2P5HRG6_DIAHE|nr:hypothetical protein DHEL01_v208770 [Diaporthe helianthi]